LVIAGEKRFLQFKDHENLTWWQILDAVGCSFVLLRRAYWPALEECYAGQAPGESKGQFRLGVKANISLGDLEIWFFHW
jgi:hypothetical protein